MLAYGKKYPNHNCFSIKSRYVKIYEDMIENSVIFLHKNFVSNLQYETKAIVCTLDSDISNIMIFH